MGLITEWQVLAGSPHEGAFLEREVRKSPAFPVSSFLNDKKSDCLKNTHFTFGVRYVLFKKTF